MKRTVMIPADGDNYMFVEHEGGKTFLKIRLELRILEVGSDQFKGMKHVSFWPDISQQNSFALKKLSKTKIILKIKKIKLKTTPSIMEMITTMKKMWMIKRWGVKKRTKRISRRRIEKSF